MEEGRGYTMKLSFELKNKGRIVQTTDDIDPLNRAQFARRICDSVQSETGQTECPVHRQGSFLLVALDVGEITFSWKIKDACCESFSDLAHPTVLDAIVRQTHPRPEKTHTRF